MKVTAEMLREKGACESQAEKFEAEWPNGVKIAEASARRAKELGLNTRWFAMHFLAHGALKIYLAADAAAWAVYEEATAAERKAYLRAADTTEETRWRLRYMPEKVKANHPAWQALARAKRIFTVAAAPALKAYYAVSALGLALAVEATD